MNFLQWQCFSEAGGQSGNVAGLCKAGIKSGRLSLNMRVAMKRLMMKYMIAGYKEQNAQYSSLNMEKISARRRLSDAHEKSGISAEGQRIAVRCANSCCTDG
nr:hypothetical protein [Escherichia coli]